MGQLKRVLEKIQAQYAELAPTQKLLFASLAVVMVMTLFLVQQYTSEPAMVELMPNTTSEQQAKAATFVKSHGYKHSLAPDGDVMVPPGTQFMILAAMTDSGALPQDTSGVFDAMIEQQSWKQTNAQTHQLEVVTVQKGLEQIISRMPGVDTATVILDIPQKRHFGTHRQEPAAVATVFANGGIDQKFADTIAHLVAGSRAGLTIERVRVIDGTSKRQYRATTEDDIAGASYVEQMLAIEKQQQSKIYRMLEYIQGVIVTVHVQVDNTRRTKDDKTVKPEGSGSTGMVESERITSSENVDLQQGGEAGVRSNTRTDIVDGSGGETSRSTDNTQDTKFATEFGMEREQVVDARGYPTKINAVVNIPRSYFVHMWQSQQPPPPADAPADAPAVVPTDTDLQSVVDAETARIQEEVRLQIDTSTAEGGEQGEVRVSMIPEVIGYGAEVAASGGGLLGTIAGGDMTVSGLVKTVALGLLAVISLGLMVITASKATKKVEMPTVEDLVGLPPALEDDQDLVGEATEADNVMSAVELTEEELVLNKMHEQVKELVQQNPEMAAQLVGRWIRGAE